jgi:hypothetical protein
LKLGGTVSLAALAGCSGGPLSDDSGGGTDGPGVVPAGANLIVEADIETLLGDDAVRDQYEQAVSDLNSGVGPQVTITELLDDLEAETGLDPRDVNTILMYADFQQEDSAVIATAEWSEDQIASAFSAAEESYKGQTLYLNNELAVGVLPDGRYVIGPAATTRGVIDVQQGDADGVEGEVVTAYDTAPAGFIRFGFVPPADFAPSAEGAFDFSSFGEISHGYGSVSQDSGTTSGVMVLETNSSDAATQIERATTGVLGMGSQRFAEDESIPEDLVTVLESTEISQSGTTVRIENDDGRGYLLLVPTAVVASFVLGLGSQSSAGGSPEGPPPNISFAGDYDPDSGTITVVAEVADADNRAGDIVVRGDTPDAGSRWHELTDASPASPDEPIAAGDSATIQGIEDGDEIQLIYESDSTSAILFTQEAASGR